MYRSVRQDNKDFTLADRTHNSTADYILVITTMTTTFMRPRYFGPIDFYTSTLSDIISTLSVNSQGYRARDTYDERTSPKPTEGDHLLHDLLPSPLARTVSDQPVAFYLSFQLESKSPDERLDEHN